VIREYTQGIPRLINSLCDGALRVGFALQAPRITSAIIEEAAEDLELTRSFDGEDLEADVNPAVLVQSLSANGANGNNGNPAPDSQIPLETYAARQKGPSFFGNLMDRWK
jgi:hypothetical protein